MFEMKFRSILPSNNLVHNFNDLHLKHSYLNNCHNNQINYSSYNIIQNFNNFYKCKKRFHSILQLCNLEYKLNYQHSNCNLFNNYYKNWNYYSQHNIIQNQNNCSIFQYYFHNIIQLHNQECKLNDHYSNQNYFNNFHNMFYQNNFHNIRSHLNKFHINLLYY